MLYRFRAAWMSQGGSPDSFMCIYFRLRTICMYPHNAISWIRNIERKIFNGPRLYSSWRPVPRIPLSKTLSNPSSKMAEIDKVFDKGPNLPLVGQALAGRNQRSRTRCGSETAVLAKLDLKSEI